VSPPKRRDVIGRIAGQNLQVDLGHGTGRHDVDDSSKEWILAVAGYQDRALYRERRITGFLAPGPDVATSPPIISSYRNSIGVSISFVGGLPCAGKPAQPPDDAGSQVMHRLCDSRALAERDPIATSGSSDRCVV